MKALSNRCTVIIAIMLFTGYASMAQKATVTDNSKTVNATEMKTYLIEREIPGAGKLTADELKAISQEGDIKHYSTLSIRPTIESALGIQG